MQLQLKFKIQLKIVLDNVVKFLKVLDHKYGTYWI